MGNTTKKITDFSIWDSVVNDRIIQFEALDEKYRNKCREMEILAEEHGRLKEKLEQVSAQYHVICNELDEKDVQIKELDQKNADLEQWIARMENSSSWKITRPIRLLMDRVKGRR